MADVSQTATAVHAHSGAQISLVQIGEGIIPGDWLYLDSAGSAKHMKAIGTSASAAAVKGMALGYGPASGNYVPMCTSGDVDVGATLTAGGGPLLISAANAGKMAPVADLGAGEFGTILGRQVEADKFNINIQLAAEGYV